MIDGTIFINYRRDDSRGDAGRLYDRLHALYPGRVFRDFGFLEPGVKWNDAIAQVLGEADACIVVIGKRWLTVTDSAGKRRLDNPRDTVRQEIVTALNSGMRIFPVLVGDADMPSEEDLPAELRPLMQRNAIELTEQDWDDDFNRLAAAIERSLGRSPEVRADVPLTGPGPPSAGRLGPGTAASSADAPPHERTKSTLRVLVVLAVLLLVGGLGYAAFRNGQLRPADPPRAEAANRVPPADRAATTGPAVETVTPEPIRESGTPVARVTKQPVPVPVPKSIGVESPSAKIQQAPGDSPRGGSAPSLPPQKPTVLFQCTGVPDVCATLRTAFDQALEKESLPGVRSLDRAEIVIAANVSLIDERTDQQFGTTFTIRTYSIDLTGEASRWSETVPMPAPKAVSFDARFGRERLAENARLIAASAVEQVQAFWKKRVP